MDARFDPSGASLGDGIYGLPFTPEASKVVLLPVPWEATVSYRAGTASGPAAILQASRQVDLLDRETGRPWQVGIVMLPIPGTIQGWSEEARAHALPVIEAGGPGEDEALRAAAACVDAFSERVNAEVYAETRRWLADGRLVGVVGGDHSSPFGAIQAVAERHPGVGILHVDAHADLRLAYEGFRHSHASIMRNVFEAIPGVARIVQVGLRDYCDEEAALIEAHPNRLRAYFDADVRRELLDGGAWRRLCSRVVAELPREVYVSFDIDGLDPSLCPSTGTPVVGGLSFAEACLLLRTVADSGRRIVGFDLSEVAPDPEGRSEWDANVGARVLYKLIGFSLISHRH